MRNYKLSAALFSILLILASHAYAQSTFNKSKIRAELNQAKSQIEAIETKIGKEAEGVDDVVEYRQKLRSIRRELEDVRGQVQPELDDLSADILDLGPKPDAAASSADGEATTTADVEPDNIRERRQNLNEAKLAVEGLAQEAEALSAKASRLLDEIAAKRRGAFISQLLERQTPWYGKELWFSAYEAYARLYAGTDGMFDKNKWGLIGSIIAALFLYIAAIFISQKMLAVRLKRDVEAGYKVVFSHVARSLILPVFALILGAIVVQQTLASMNIMNDLNNPLGYHFIGLTAFFMGAILALWRLDKTKLIRDSMFILGCAGVSLYCVDAILLNIGQFFNTPIELPIAQSYLVTSIFAYGCIFCSIVALRLRKTRKTTTRTYFLPRQIFYLFMATGIFLICANLFGYAALSRYVFERIVMLTALFATILFIRSMVRPYILKIDRYFHPVETDETDNAQGNIQGKTQGNSQGNIAQNTSTDIPKKQEYFLVFWMSAAIDTMLFLGCLPLIASMVGAEWSNIQTWAYEAFFGFKVGNMTISISSIVFAFVAFLVVMFIFKILQNILGNKILPKTKIDISMQQSITQVLGYTGLVVAGLAWLSGIGFDLTNLALIAGALSIGIGFGLQSIVSNFVSGLILLFERPIKVNDWVVTNSGEGIVKKIRVRATEIETFDRTSIIVPNSELISSSVKNWTYKDKIGRGIVAVGVSYDSDPHQVYDLLLECAKKHKMVLNDPPPRVVFKDFADSALLFELRFFMRNISDVFVISTQIRLDIWDCFKEKEIEISFPQRDLHIRSVPGLKDLGFERQRRPQDERGGKDRDVSDSDEETKQDGNTENNGGDTAKDTPKS